MNLLAIDAGLGPFTAALCLRGSISSDRAEGNDALETGLQRIAALLERGAVSLTDLDRVAVGVGPGSFTGIRIALSFAKALAFAADVPLIGISSYDAITPPDARDPCLALISGRPGIVCARLTNGGAHAIACGSPEMVLTRLLHAWDAENVLSLATNTEVVFPPVAEGIRVHRLSSPAEPNAAVAIASLARLRQPTSGPHSVGPDYGEMPAVTVPKAATAFVR